MTDRVSVRLDDRTVRRLDDLSLSYRTRSQSELVRKSIDYLWEATFGRTKQTRRERDGLHSAQLTLELDAAEGASSRA